MIHDGVFEADVTRENSLQPFHLPFAMSFSRSGSPLKQIKSRSTFCGWISASPSSGSNVSWRRSFSVWMNVKFQSFSGCLQMSTALGTQSRVDVKVCSTRFDKSINFLEAHNNFSFNQLDDIIESSLLLLTRILWAVTKHFENSFLLNVELWREAFHLGTFRHQPLSLFVRKIKKLGCFFGIPRVKAGRTTIKLELMPGACWLMGQFWGFSFKKGSICG